MWPSCRSQAEMRGVEKKVRWVFFLDLKCFQQGKRTRIYLDEVPSAVMRACRRPPMKL